jgi:hypothetical protein
MLDGTGTDVRRNRDGHWIEWGQTSDESRTKVR